MCRSSTSAPTSTPTPPQGKFDFSGGLISTGDSAFVNFQDTDYEVPQSCSTSSRRPSTSSGAEQPAVRPEQELPQAARHRPDHLADRRAERGHRGRRGNRDHSRLGHGGRAEAARRHPDRSPRRRARRRSSSRPSSSQQADGRRSSRRLRRLLRRGRRPPPQALGEPRGHPARRTPGAPDSLNVDFSLTFSDVNEPQSISAPRPSAQPISSTCCSSCSTRASWAERSRAASAPACRSRAVDHASSSGASQAYLQCLQTAQGQARALDSALSCCSRHRAGAPRGRQAKPLLLDRLAMLGRRLAYLLVPFIPLAVVLDLIDAPGTSSSRHRRSG